MFIAVLLLWRIHKNERTNLFWIRGPILSIYTLACFIIQLYPIYYLIEKYQQSTDLFSDQKGMDPQKCLPLAVREINKDQLIFLHIKRCGGSSKMPSYRCEKHQQRTDLFADQKVMQWIFKSAFLSMWRKFTTDLFLHQKGMQSGVFNILFDNYRCLKINYFSFIVKK